MGLSSGPALAASITEPVGWKLLVVGVLAAVVGTGLLAILADRTGLHTTRGGGLIAGFVGNPSYRGDRSVTRRACDAVDHVTRTHR